MVIQLSPQIETPRIDLAPVSSSVSGVEGPYAPEAERPEDRIDDGTGEIGAFAEILAGLLRKTEIAEAGAAVDAETEAGNLAVPPAETEEALTGAAEENLSAAGAEPKKSRWMGETAAEDEPAGAGAALEAELARIDFSEEEKNILLGVRRLLNYSAEQNAPAEEQPAPVFTLAEMTGPALDPDGLFAELARAETVSDFEPRLDLSPAEKSEEFAGAELAAAAVPDAAEAELTAGKLAAQNGPRKNETVPPAEGKTRLEAARSRDKRRGLSVEVRDYRSVQTESGQKSGGLRVLANAETRQSAEGSQREIILELRLPDQGQNAASPETVWETKAGRAFEDLLARELHQNFNNDIVRHASMALRDGGEGTIRLALKPESLGNVKIRLEMAENKITGHIVVESEEALRAFEREIHSLEQAFKDSGFEGANLEMSLANSAADGQGAEQQRQGAQAPVFLPGQLAASQYGAALDRAELQQSAVVDVYRRGLTLVNMLA